MKIVLILVLMDYWFLSTAKYATKDYWIVVLILVLMDYWFLRYTSKNKG